MKKTFILFGIFLACVLQAQNNISNYPYFDAEPSIAVSPVNSQYMVAAWMKAITLNQVSIASCYSSNGGVTWSTPTLLPHVKTGYTHADVSLTYTSTGTPYICFIDSKISADSGYVMVANSSNNGQTWNTPVKVTSATEGPDLPVDRPWIAIDNSSGTYAGRIYVTSKSYYAAPLPHYIWMKSSSDGGNTWSVLKRLDDSIPADQVTNSMGAICVGSDGKVYVAYASYDPAINPYGRMICTRSADGGAHFTPYPISNFASNSTVTDTLYHAAYVISASPTIASNLILSGIDARDGDPDVMSYHSSDAGNTWNPAPVRVNDDAVGNGVGQDMCWAGFSSNYYYVAWRDRRNGGTTSTSNFEIYFSGSTDNGVTFCPNINLSGATSSPSINIRRGNDFIGLATSPNAPGFWSDWSDYRTGNCEIMEAASSISSSCQVGIVELHSIGLPLRCYPNPGDGHIHLLLSLAETGKVKLDVYDIRGALIKSLSIDGTKGENDIPLDLSKLQAGTYLLKATTSTGSGQIQIEKQ